MGAGCGLPAIATALYCKPAKVFVTDIHAPTLVNAQHNVDINRKALSSSSSNSSRAISEKGSTVEDNQIQLQIVEQEKEDDVTEIHCVSLNWKNLKCPEGMKADILLGSDLVYDTKILAMLVPAIKEMLHQGILLVSL
jgi:predicted nicotinamide N-methyase